MTLKDSKTGYHLTVKGIGATYASNLAASFKVVTTNENIHCLWHKDREVRSNADREQIRKVVTTFRDGVGPKLGDNSQNVYTGGTFAIRNFTKPYKFSVSENRTVHGGINYATPKDRDFMKPLVLPHGPTSDGAPQNVVVLGVGQGQGFQDPRPCTDEELSPNAKETYNSTAIIGRFSNFDGSKPISGSNIGSTPQFAYNIKGEKIFPFNLIKGVNATGYNKNIHDLYEKDAILVNLHSDTTDYTNEIPIQGPFTQQWVGGRQSRHVAIGRGNEGPTTRPEEWRILIGEHESLDIVDGALGFTGPDYGSPYPSPARRWAIYYRDGRAKRPLNLANIQHTTASANLGNFQRNYEVINSVGRKENNRVFKRKDSSFNYLPTELRVLPQTTNAIGLLGLKPSANGNTQLNNEDSNRATAQLLQQATWNTGSTKSIIVSRFSAPGGIETSPAYSDVYSKEYSPYNSINFRNLMVRGSGSGEALKLRVDSHAGRREGLRTLLSRHCGKFGLDSQHGVVSSTDYVAEASFHKIPRNTLTRPVSGSSSVIIAQKRNNFTVQTPIPQSDYNYSWVTSSLGSNYSVRSGVQKVYGYWPKDGILSSSVGFDSAITFPTASQIYGS